jgi:site-specific DNA recombinase
MKKAVLYARVSSDLQRKEKTIESQLAELRKQIARAGDELVHSYVDDGYSGAQLDRPAMNELRDDLKGNLFDTVYILNTDRIARDVTYQNIIIGEMLRYGKQIIINGKDYVDNPENKFTLTVLGAVSELERAKLIERTSRGKQHRLNQGRLLGLGSRTFGYRYNRKTPDAVPSYEINDDEAKIVRHIFETYAKGEIGIRTIANSLKGVSNRNNLVQTNVKHILKNEMYTGTRYFNTMTVLKTGDPLVKKQSKKVVRTDRDAWIGIKVPAIIDRKLFDRVQAMLEKNRTLWRNKARSYLLSGMVWCDNCGSVCFAYRRYYRVRTGNKEYVYHRASYKCRKRPSDNPEMDSRLLERVVFGMLVKTIADPASLHELIGTAKSGKSKRYGTGKELPVIEQSMRRIESHKARIEDLHGSGDLRQAEYSKRISGCEKELDELARQRKRFIRQSPLLQNKERIDSAIAEYCSNLAKSLELAVSFENKRKLVREHVKRISYSRKGKTSMKVSLHGSVPIVLPSETVELEFSVTHKVNKAEMGRLMKERDSVSEIYGLQEKPATKYGELKSVRELGS